MGGRTGRLLGRDVKRDLAMHVFISYLSRSVYMERTFAGTFFVPLATIKRHTVKPTKQFSSIYI